MDEAGRGDRRRVALEWAFVGVLFVAAFVVRLWGVSHLHGWDENVYLQNAELICCGKNNYNEIDSRPPLLSILFAAAFRVWHSDYAAYLVTSALNALGPVFLYLAGRMYVGRRAAAIAALLLGFTPFFVSVFPAGYWVMSTGHGLLSDSPALTLIVLAFWLLLLGLRRDEEMQESGWLFGWAGFVLAMAVLMRFPSASSVGMLWLLTLTARRPLRAAGWCAVGFAVGMAPYFGWSRWRYGGFLATFQSGWVNFSGPRPWGLFYVQHSPIIFGWVALAGLALWAGWCGWRAWQRRGAVFVSWRGLVQSDVFREGFLGVWGLALLVCFSLIGHKEQRYVMPVAPPLFLLSGVGLSVLLRGRRPGARMGGVVVLAGLLCYDFWPDWHRFEGGLVDHTVSEEMRLSVYLTQTLPPDTIVYTNLNYPNFGYYTNFEIDALQEDGPELYEELNDLPKDGILIAYKVFEGRAPEPPIAWLDANPHFTRVREFKTVVVYRFRK
jgi:hypothetical protein